MEKTAAREMLWVGGPRPRQMSQCLGVDHAYAFLAHRRHELLVSHGKRLLSMGLEHIWKQMHETSVARRAVAAAIADGFKTDGSQPSRPQTSGSGDASEAGGQCAWEAGGKMLLVNGQADGLGHMIRRQFE